MTLRIFIVLLLLSSVAVAEQGTIRLRRIAPAPKPSSQAMKTQREIAARVSLQNDYYLKSSELQRGENRLKRLKADLEFARIADPERIDGIRKALKVQTVNNAKLKREIAKLHDNLTRRLKRSPASVGKPIRRK